MPTVLITGASRGLGLEFCRQYAAADWHVIACCRNPDNALDLLALQHQFNDLSVFELDVENSQEIDQLADDLSDQAIDVLINNAGIYGDDRSHGFGNLDYSAWSKTLAVNLQAPVKMAEAFLPQIKRSEKKLLVAISSLMGSIADNNSGGSIFYRTSKAGVNAAMKSLAIDLNPQGVGVLVFHPGWVKTDMGGFHALIEPAESIAGMIAQIEQFSLQQTGCFIKYDGASLPW